MLAPKETVACSVGATDVYTAVHLLGVELAGVTRVDGVFSLAEGELRYEDLPFDAEKRRVVFVQRADWIRTMPGGIRDIKLVSVEPSGDRELARYRLNHTAYVP